MAVKMEDVGGSLAPELLGHLHRGAGEPKVRAAKQGAHKQGGGGAQGAQPSQVVLATSRTVCCGARGPGPRRPWWWWWWWLQSRVRVVHG